MSLLDAASTDPEFQWNARAARHLLNRAGFGVPPSAVTKLAAMKPEEAVAAFVDWEKLADHLSPPDWLPKTFDYKDMRKVAKQLTEDERRRLRQERQREGREAVSRLQVWWLDRMCRTYRPLEEKLTLFWHGHFATSAEKVQDPTYNYELNQVFREHGGGNFRTLVTEVGKSPAMLRYLDQAQSNVKKPNENWARELMELFTLGIGNYTEQDIKEAARAFTGWTDRSGAFHYDPKRHDNKQKTIFGRTANYTGDDVISIILQQPACPEFICRKLWKFFAYEDPEPEIVTGLAETFRQHKYEIRPVLRQMFSSRAFYSDKAYATQIKSPAQLVVGLLSQMQAPLDDRPPIAQLAMRAMGQSLFSPPNVKGWDGGRAWINTNTLLVRYNFASFLASGVVPDFGRGGGQVIRELKEAMERKTLVAQTGRGRRAGGRPGVIPAAASMDGGMMMAGAEPMMSGGMMMDEGMGMTEQSMAPAGQDAMPPDNPNRTLYSALRKKRGEKLTKEEEAMNLAPFRAPEFFSQFEGMTAEEMVDELVNYFIGFPLEDTQKSKLIAALTKHTKPGLPLSITQIPEADMRATVQLLLSTAEYQVC